MARPKVFTLTATGVSAAYPTNHYQTPFHVGLGLDVTGTVNVTVQHSFDDPQASYATDYNTNATWFDHDVLASQTSDADGNYAFPVQAIRLKYNSGSGSASLTIIQAGSAG